MVYYGFETGFYIYAKPLYGQISVGDAIVFTRPSEEGGQEAVDLSWMPFKILEITPLTNEVNRYRMMPFVWDRDIVSDPTYEAGLRQQVHPGSDSFTSIPITTDMNISNVRMVYDPNNTLEYDEEGRLIDQRFVDYSTPLAMAAIRGPYGASNEVVTEQQATQTRIVRLGESDYNPSRHDLYRYQSNEISLIANDALNPNFMAGTQFSPLNMDYSCLPVTNRSPNSKRSLLPNANYGFHTQSAILISPWHLLVSVGLGSSFLPTGSTVSFYNPVSKSIVQRTTVGTISFSGLSDTIDATPPDYPVIEQGLLSYSGVRWLGDEKMPPDEIPQPWAPYSFAAEAIGRYLNRKYHGFLYPTLQYCPAYPTCQNCIGNGFPGTFGVACSDSAFGPRINSLISRFRIDLLNQPITEVGITPASLPIYPFTPYSEQGTVPDKIGHAVMIDKDQRGSIVTFGNFARSTQSTAFAKFDATPSLSNEYLNDEFHGNYLGDYDSYIFTKISNELVLPVGVSYRDFAYTDTSNDRSSVLLASYDGKTVFVGHTPVNFTARSPSAKVPVQSGDIISLLPGDLGDVIYTKPLDNGLIYNPSSPESRLVYDRIITVLQTKFMVFPDPLPADLNEEFGNPLEGDVWNRAITDAGVKPFFNIGFMDQYFDGQPLPPLPEEVRDLRALWVKMVNKKSREILASYPSIDVPFDFVTIRGDQPLARQSEEYQKTVNWLYAPPPPPITPLVTTDTFPFYRAPIERASRHNPSSVNVDRMNSTNQQVAVTPSELTTVVGLVSVGATSFSTPFGTASFEGLSGYIKPTLNAISVSGNVRLVQVDRYSEDYPSPVVYGTTAQAYDAAYRTTMSVSTFAQTGQIININPPGSP